MEHQSRRPAENDRRTERTPQEAARRTDGPLPVQAALEALLAGGSLTQLPAEPARQLAARLGNDALCVLLRSRPRGPALSGPPPAAAPELPPLDCPDAAPELSPAPDMGALAFPAGPPLTV